MINTFYTSYFGAASGWPNTESVKIVSVARFKPKGFHKVADFEIFAPSQQLLQQWKDGNLEPEEYTRTYLDDLARTLDDRNHSTALFNLLELDCLGYYAIMFVCWEKPSDFCHRKIIGNVVLPEWLGLEPAREWEAEDDIPF